MSILDEIDLTELVKDYEEIPKLTRRQQIFVDRYLESGAPYKAALAAGYSPKSAYKHAYKLLATPKIRKAIEIHQKALRLRNKVTQDYFVTNLKKIVDSNFAKISDRIAALSLLARVTGFIKEKAPESKQLVILKQETPTKIESSSSEVIVMPEDQAKALLKE